MTRYFYHKTNHEVFEIKQIKRMNMDRVSNPEQSLFTWMLCDYSTGDPYRPYNQNFKSYNNPFTSRFLDYVIGNIYQSRMFIEIEEEIAKYRIAGEMCK